MEKKSSRSIVLRTNVRYNTIKIDHNGLRPVRSVRIVVFGETAILNYGITYTIGLSILGFTFFDVIPIF